MATFLQGLHLIKFVYRNYYTQNKKIPHLHITVKLLMLAATLFSAFASRSN